MILSLLVAMDEDRGIGKDGRMPWHLSTDLKLFKQLTMGHHILMGRKTFDSIGRLLPGRMMMILTRNTDFQAPGVVVVHSLEDALELAKKASENEFLIIGGGDIFRQSIAIANRIYLTRVHTYAGCDVFFPELEEDQWVEFDKTLYPADENNEFSFTFSRLERITPSNP